MRIELKGLLAAVIAGLAVVGGAFGVSALVVGAQTAQTDRAATALTHAAHSPGASPQVADTAFVAQGHAFYTQSCASCHGADGAGGFAPNLRRSDLSDAEIALKIVHGVQGKMPAFGDKYAAPQVRTLTTYLRSLH